jgi:hypothetical protein
MAAAALLPNALWELIEPLLPSHHRGRTADGARV